MAQPYLAESDDQLVRRTLAGDRAAFGHLVQRHRPSVARLLRAAFGNLAGIDDLLQDSFLRAYLDLEQLRDPQRFGPWVRTIALNLARMELRAGRRPLLSLEAMEFTPPGALPSPEWLAERRELLRAIRQAIAALPAAEREAIRHVYLYELSHEEAAHKLNTSKDAIKVRVYRGRRRLRAALNAQLTLGMKQMEAEMIEVTVHDVLAKLAEGEEMPQIDPTTAPLEQAHQLLMRLRPGDHRVVLLSEKNGPRLLPIWVGPVEAESIVVQLIGFSPARPLTFDLMQKILTVGNMRVRQVAISRLHEEIFYGTLTIQGNGVGAQTEIDCRPSDAINLALRTQAPIVVSPQIMDQAAVTPSPDAPHDYLEREEGQRWVSLLAR